MKFAMSWLAVRCGRSNRMVDEYRSSGSVRTAHARPPLTPPARASIAPGRHRRVHRRPGVRGHRGVPT